MGPRPYVPPGRDGTAPIAAPAPGESSSNAPPALPAASSEILAGPGLARVRSAANMRFGPNTKSDAVGVVPTDALLQVVSCEGWYEVIYDGQRGSRARRGARPVTSAMAPTSPLHHHQT